MDYYDYSVILGVIGGALCRQLRKVLKNGWIEADSWR